MKATFILLILTELTLHLKKSLRCSTVNKATEQCDAHQAADIAFLQWLDHSGDWVISDVIRVKTEADRMKIVVAYVGWLFVAWSAYVLWVYPCLVSPHWTFRILIQELFRLTIFICPLFLILSHKEFRRQLGMTNCSGTVILRGIVAAAAWGTASSLIAVYFQGKSSIRCPQPEFWLTGFTIATIIEEVAFRGYLTNTLAKHGAWFSIIISSMLFVLIHYPGWFILSMMPTSSAYATTSVSIFLLGIVVGWLCLQTKSIWPGVLVHSTNNVIAAMLTTSTG